MPAIGVLGGMGPAATVDFMAKVVSLTPACCDQEHLPLVVASVPQVPDRSAAILGRGEDPLPALLRGIELLNRADVGCVVIPCNTSHHWYAPMQEACHAPILHIAQAAVRAVPDGARTLILATRGALQSGFYQRALEERGLAWELPATAEEQHAVDETIRLVKAGQVKAGGNHLADALRAAARRGTAAVILGCTELPLAVSVGGSQGLVVVDSTLELARTAVDHGLARGWQRG